jgi:hypothetical protein
MARLPLSASLELYLMLPVGPSVQVLNGEPMGRQTLSDTALGYHLSAVFGSRIALSARVGMFVEAGYLLRSVEHELDIGITRFVDGPTGGGMTTVIGPHLRATTAQFVCRAGVVF